MVSNFNTYLGGEGQLPDPVMESQLGAGNVPAHRGLAYVVFSELDLDPFGNVIPTMNFEVVSDCVPTYTTTANQDAPDMRSQMWLQIENVQPVQVGNSGLFGWAWGHPGRHHTDLKALSDHPVWLDVAGEGQLHPSMVNLPSPFPLDYQQSFDEPGVLCADGSWVTVDGVQWQSWDLVAPLTASCIKRSGSLYLAQGGFTTGPLIRYDERSASTVKSSVSGAYKLARHNRRIPVCHRLRRRCAVAV